MSVENASTSQTSLTPAQAAMQALWEEHLAAEVATKDTEAALATMVPAPYIYAIPTATGRVGLDQVREFYSNHFIPQIPPDAEIILVSRTIGTDQLVDEMVLKFTHTTPMDWMLPSVAPTGNRVEVPMVGIIGFRDGKIAHEHLYWDQATVLLQLGLIDAASLPIVGAASAENLLNLGSQRH